MGNGHIDLFSGIGGFTLACQWAGIETEVFCESDKRCQDFLRRTYPGVPIIPDIREFDGTKWRGRFLLTCGDPCPIRSKARSIWKTKSPDLSGYALRVVGTSRPEWVLRENVPASDDVDFCAALGLLGYTTVIVSANSAKITAQNRERDFIMANRDPGKIYRFINTLPIIENGKRYAETKREKTPAYPVLTTHPCRWDARDGYIWDGRGIRVADSQERLTFAGFPRGWLDGFSKTAVAKMTGNAVVPQVAYEIVRAIKEADGESDPAHSNSTPPIRPWTGRCPGGDGGTSA